MKGTKIINDPVHGFIEVPKGILLDLIDTEEFQRLRRIQQLALSSLVYPGAVHTRFNHCIGAMFLTGLALDVLRSKGVSISDEEYESTMIAILLHDIGHGPFSHALENVILQGLHHERMSRAIMERLNTRFKGRLSLAIRIFDGVYPRHFLHQLVSSQLDMDRMDYLKRDSYFTGVVEGLVSADRIIKTLTVVDDRLALEAKGIYSVEKFIVARRLMYWQVYLHRAVLSSEYMMVNILQRARELMYAQKPIWKNQALEFLFSKNTLIPEAISPETMQHYLELDDQDILFAIKQWRHSKDKILNLLCNNLLQRRLFKARIEKNPIDPEVVRKLRAEAMKRFGVDEQEAKYLVVTGEVFNQAYLKGTDDHIKILNKDGTLQNIEDASDIQNVNTLAEPVTKWFICFPGEIF